jgi:hypothetical protein
LLLNILPLSFFALLSIAPKEIEQYSTSWQYILANSLYMSIMLPYIIATKSYYPQMRLSPSFLRQLEFSFDLVKSLV